MEGPRETLITPTFVLASSCWHFAVLFDTARSSRPSSESLLRGELPARAFTRRHCSATLN